MSSEAESLTVFERIVLDVLALLASDGEEDKVRIARMQAGIHTGLRLAADHPYQAAMLLEAYERVVVMSPDSSAAMKALGVLISRIIDNAEKEV